MALPVRWLVVATVVFLAGLAVAFVPVAGTFQNEDFHCGTPFHYDNSEGYRGSEEFETCNNRREARRPLALGLILVGLGTGTFALLGAKRRAVKKAAAGSG